MSVTIDRFELVSDASPTPARDGAKEQGQGEGGASNKKLSRHELASLLRLEHERALRVRAT